MPQALGLTVLVQCLCFRAEKEYVTLSNQLQAELEEKKTLIGSLSEQLDLHQQNFDQLKQELNKVCPDTPPGGNSDPAYSAYKFLSI